jgi:hypothetical protein
MEALEQEALRLEEETRVQKPSMNFVQATVTGTALKPKE